MCYRGRGAVQQRIARGRMGAWVVATLLVLLVQADLVATASPRARQDFPAAGATLTAVGVGMATEPADFARIQVLIVADADSDSLLTTRRARNDALTEEPTRERLRPIIDTILAHGISSELIEIIVNPVESSDPDARRILARIDFSVWRPSAIGLRGVIAGVSATAATDQISLGEIAVRFDPEGCELVLHRAELNAISDAEQRANRLATRLQLAVGEMIALSLTGVPRAAPNGYACLDLGELSERGAGSEGLGVTLPMYDPSQPAAVTIYAEVSVTYAVASDTGT